MHNINQLQQINLVYDNQLLKLSDIYYYYYLLWLLFSRHIWGIWSFQVYSYEHIIVFL
jgi:hypothetical protein